MQKNKKARKKITKIKKSSILITSRNKQFEAKELRKIYVVPKNILRADWQCGIDRGLPPNNKKN